MGDVPKNTKYIHDIAHLRYRRSNTLKCMVDGELGSLKVAARWRSSLDLDGGLV